MNPRSLPSYRLWNSVVRMLVAVIGLAIMRAVVLRLPMLSDVPIGSLPLPLSELLALVAVTAIFVVLVVFGRQLSDLTSGLGASAAVIGQLAEYVLAVVVVVLGYKAYEALALELLGGESWIYPTVFIVLGVIPLIGIVVLVYRNLDLLTSSIVRGVSKPGGYARGGTVACGKCGQQVSLNAAFCPSCGATVVRPAVAQAPSCNACGAVLNANSKFCPMCGQPSSGQPAQAGGAPAPAAAGSSACAKCGQALSADAKFCGGCGSQVAAGPPAS